MDVADETRISLTRPARQAMLAVAIALALMAPASRGGVLSESDSQKAESLRPLFANLMSDLIATAKRSDISAGDSGCLNSTIRELLQISDELASYEYLIAMDKDISGFGDQNPMRDIVRFAAEKSSTILAGERKRLVQLSEQCTQYPLASDKTQQAIKVIDTTAGILGAIRGRL